MPDLWLTFHTTWGQDSTVQSLLVNTSLEAEAAFCQNEIETQSSNWIALMENWNLIIDETSFTITPTIVEVWNNYCADCRLIDESFMPFFDEAGKITYL
jgi:hypothetical protein